MRDDKWLDMLERQHVIDGILIGLSIAMALLLLALMFLG